MARSIDLTFSAFIYSRTLVVRFGSQPEVYRIFLGRLLSRANQSFDLLFINNRDFTVGSYRKQPLSF